MLIKTIKLCKSYPQPNDTNLKVLESLDFEVREGEFICLLGPTGCGKTTLLRILSKLEVPTNGEIVDSCKKLSYVFQQGALFPWMSVIDNVSFPLRARGISNKRGKEVAAEMLEAVGLQDFLRSYPHELSGGMQQRTALARGLVTEPDLLLLDEPFASLDEKTSFRLQDMLRKLCDTLSTSVVFVTHNIEEAVYLADRIMVMSNDSGFVVRNEPITLPWPRNRLSVEFTDSLISFRQTFEKLVDLSISAFSVVDTKQGQ